MTTEYARIIEDATDPIVVPYTREALPASVRERLTPKTSPVAKTRTGPASGRAKPTAPIAQPPAPKPAREAVAAGPLLAVSTRKPVASPDRVAARRRADERLRRAGVDERIIGAIPPPVAVSPARERADSALRARNVPEAIIQALRP